jgi:hypothetical protein
MNRLESMAEKKLREAIENGEFDDLPGKGEPIDLEEFRAKVAELNKRISIYNLKAPAAVFHRKKSDADKGIETVCNANC